MTKIVKNFPVEYQKIEKDINALNRTNIFQYVHERSRLIYTKYRNGEITSSLYSFLCKNQYVDVPLTIYWQKQGYESLCCILCVYSEDKSKEKVCICRVPQRNLEHEKIVECSVCRCMGCGGY
ncbi:hypothetical protein VCUG_02411 [Vavraia culicis subsp. floridensis]|uniref:G10 protein n=1 Tax=Vavraia culicis (isolate floridensis) TaxID=948595 RepID=L2GS18_VAVCU|nr:uncharacterized protein VCUG_02411 [Vavraia culicis subsp. floridensis]ELA46103.1 hypothetical protein VCUG_02411 [Vavraia culicis subsp. floridensis]